MPEETDFKGVSCEDVSHQAFALSESAVASQSGKNQMSCRMNQMFTGP